jgi:hypothetical protein
MVSARPAVYRASERRVDELQLRLIKLVRSSPVSMRALRAARAVDAPDWLIGGAVIRDRVWDHLHGHARAAPSKDVDLMFFDPASPECETESSVLRELTALATDISWDVTNQAQAHLWYPQIYGVELAPLRCSGDAVGTWAETATAVAIRLMADDRIHVAAPCGLTDLFGMVCRRNPRVLTSEQYRQRVARLKVATHWPRVQILDSHGSP